jgi:5,10-methylenetetrahydromethanopterin reductase
LREAVEVVGAILRGEPYEGAVFRGVAPRYPVYRDRVDVLIGTWGSRGAEVAAACADEVKLGGCANPDMVALMRSWLGDAAVGVVAGAVTVVDTDRAVARARARAEVAMYVDVVAALDRTVTVEDELVARLRTLVAAGAHDEAGRLIPDDLLDRFCFAGTPDEVAEHAERLFEAGASRVEFGTPHGTTDRNGVDLLGRLVLPRLRNAG